MAAGQSAKECCDFKTTRMGSMQPKWFRRYGMAVGLGPLHRALRRMAGLVFLLVFWVSGGRLPKARRGRFLLYNTTTTMAVGHGVWFVPSGEAGSGTALSVEDDGRYIACAGVNGVNHTLTRQQLCLDPPPGGLGFRSSPRPVIRALHPSCPARRQPSSTQTPPLAANETTAVKSHVAKRHC